jgi:hypothetical protein
MSSTTNTCIPAQDAGIPAKDNSAKDTSNRHFDTFETRFFQEGDESAGHAVAPEVFDDLDDGAQRRGFRPSRQFVMRVAIGSAALVILGSFVLWNRTGGPTVSPAATKASPAAASPAAALSEPAQPSAQAVAPVVAQGLAAAQAEPAPAAQAEPASAAQAEPAWAAQVAPAPVAQVVPPAPGPVAPVPPVRPALAAAAAETAKPVDPQPAADPTFPKASPSGADADEAHSRCKKALSGRRTKEILVACAEAFAVDPTSVDIAVAMAKTEFDRGRTAQAFVWGKKAIAIDADAAEAYVFIGGAEQSAGHAKAAKDAYKRYLQLAPGGRYAADLRSVIGSL